MVGPLPATHSFDAGFFSTLRWMSARGGNRDVYVYFDNDAKVHAPFDAMRLMERLGVP